MYCIHHVFVLALRDALFQNVTDCFILLFINEQTFRVFFYLFCPTLQHFIAWTNYCKSESLMASDWITTH